MNQQDGLTPTTTPAAAHTGSDWTVRIEVLSPQFANPLIEHVGKPPRGLPILLGTGAPAPDITVRHHVAGMVTQALARVPEHLDLGADAHGRPIIAFEAIFAVRVVGPDGAEQVIPCVDGIGVEHRGMIGWQTLAECAERYGAGNLESAPNPKSPEGLPMWVLRGDA
jgi:hypothetical protein